MKISKHLIYGILILAYIREPLYAQVEKKYDYAALNVASSINFSNNSHSNIANNIVEEKILDDLDNSFNKKPSRKALLSFLRKINANQNTADLQYGSKLYIHLADMFARLKLYPLVMKCYFKTISPVDDEYKKGHFIKPNTDTTFSVAEKDTGYLNDDDLLTINNKDSLLLKTDSGSFNHNEFEIKSKPIPEYQIVDPFNDGKTAVKYAMLIHIQQPLSGKPKIFIKINRVGHTFITLIKYNSDSTYIARSFGFYPQKDNILSATPIFPSSASVFKNDNAHDWDEVVGKFISKRRFQKILQLVKQYDSRKYNLNKNNCTDFGLNVAAIGGISILNTYGKWPLGSGNNPATAGQSILNGKVSNTDTGNKDDLFIYNDIVPVN